ncbi:MAG TPA: murein L,D-transpeptidase catalytic domain family protein [Chitinophagaceae bacterium]|nr:murein L,D-transpeptidase catalytic domain family protein [Chitinophagaceae bacterium]
MKKRIRGFYLIISTCLIALLNLAFAVAKSTTGHKPVISPVPPAKKTAPVAPVLPLLRSVYDSLHLGISGLSQQAFDYAKKGFNKLAQEGRLLNDSIISIVDFSLPSNQKRLFVLDMKNYKVLYNTFVAHGQNTGREWASSFSNQNESHKSSPGFYVTMGTYEGKNGYSLKLNGMEQGINDKAYERGIVMHGAAYVSQELANTRGWVGRSHGCPAVPTQLNKPIINSIKNGSCFFIYHPSYVDRSPILN